MHDNSGKSKSNWNKFHIILLMNNLISKQQVRKNAQIRHLISISLDILLDNIPLFRIV